MEEFDIDTFSFNPNDYDLSHDWDILFDMYNEETWDFQSQHERDAGVFLINYIVRCKNCFSEVAYTVYTGSSQYFNDYFTINHQPIILLSRSRKVRKSYLLSCNEYIIKAILE